MRWPTGSNVLDIVRVDADAKLRRERGHAARLWMADPQTNEVVRIANGDSGPTGYRHYHWIAAGHGQRQFVATLSCQRSEGCPESDLAKTYVRNVRLMIADYADPIFSALGGTLWAAGWIRGVSTLHAQARDSGSGLAGLSVNVNGTQLAPQYGNCDQIPGTAYAARVEPCRASLLLDASPATNQAPFHDGDNAVSVCARDFAGNRSCNERAVRVDNTPPALSFTSSQDPNDPELIRTATSDPTSGVGSGQIFYRPVGQTSWRPLDTQLQPGELRARIDSTIDPPGDYEFMAQAMDVAGNVAQTSSRADGQPMKLAFPLKSGVKLNAYLAGGSSNETVEYRQPSKVAGRLRDASGEPLADQKVTVTEYFGAGALIDRRIRIVRTDSDGLWGERLPSGPSRKVAATYGGDSRYLPDDARAGKLHVKTKATFRLSNKHVQEGKRVLFSGRVAHLAARIPAGGKLIELEVKDGHHWHTVRHPFYTRSDGSYRLRYRFARFYTSNVSYRFRVKVLRERGWPYKAPVSSRVRRLVVKAG